MLPMAGIDKLAALGWPVTPQTAQNMGTLPLPCRDTKRAAAVAGNAMHLGNAGVVLLTALACFGPAPACVS